MQHRNKCRTHGKAHVAAEVQEAGEEAPALVSGIFTDESCGTGVLAAGGEALNDLKQDQQAGRPQADLRVAGQQADGEGARSHDHEGGGQNLLPANLVTQPAEDHAAKGACNEGGGECSQQEQVSRGGI
ncbi:hypothetical protein D9M72_593170 [compost metagenome]